MISYTPAWWARFREWAGCHRAERGTTITGYTGGRALARCRDCHRRIYSDGNGGWFLASVQPIELDDVDPKVNHPLWLPARREGRP